MYAPSAGSASRAPDYSQWSIEELWKLATQLRIANARRKSRRELIDLFAVPPTPRRGSSTLPTRQ
jgi:hypothetical protein